MNSKVKSIFSQSFSLYLFMVFFLLVVGLGGGCYTIGLVSSQKRSNSFEKEIPKLQITRSFLKAKTWAEYRIAGPGARILEDRNGYIEGKGFLKCLVHYGVGEVDVDEHKFHYRIEILENKVRFSVSDLFSYKNDPYDSILNYGPKSERLATSTWRGCFQPLFQDLVEYIE